MEHRWNGPAQVKALGDDPTQAQINALFAIPGDTKTDSSLPHHDVSTGKVGAADKDGCIAAIGALNGAQGGVDASQAQKNRAYSHLASHLRSMGVEPPEKKFALPKEAEYRSQRRLSMIRTPEQLQLAFSGASLELRAKANGTGGTRFHFTGYGAVFDHPFEMWDFWGDAFTEVVNQGSFTRTLANNCDVPFLIGHNVAGIPMARTKSGTMSLGQDTHGLWVDVPDLDGTRDDVRALASAVERGDMDEMSIGFMVLQQQWSPDYEQRNILEIDLHKGDVSAVVFGANDGTAGSSMLPTSEGLILRRPTGVRQRSHRGERRAADEIVDMSGAPDYNPVPHNYDPAAIPCTASDDCTAKGVKNSPDAKFCDQCGSPVPAESYSGNGTEVVDDSGVVEDIEGAAMSDAELLAHRGRELELLEMGA